MNNLKFGKNTELKIVSCGHDLENVDLNIAYFEANQVRYVKVRYFPQNYIAKEIGIFKTIETLDL